HGSDEFARRPSQGPARAAGPGHVRRHRRALRPGERAALARPGRGLAAGGDPSRPPGARRPRARPGLRDGRPDAGDASGLAVVAPAVGALVGWRGAYRYLARSLAQLPSPERVSGMLEEAGFDQAAARPLTGGIVTLFTGVRRRGSPVGAGR